MQATEELTKSIEDLRTEVTKDTDAHGERLEKVEKIAADLSKSLKESQRNANVRALFPEMDPRMLKFDSSQKSFERLMESRPAGDGGIVNPVVKELQKRNDECIVMDAIARSFRSRGGSSAAPEMTQLKSYGEFQGMASELQKAMDTAAAGQGAEWVPTGFSQTLMEQIRLELRVAALFQTINMPTNPFTWPFSAARPLAQVAPQATATAAYGAVLADGDRAFDGLTPTDNITFTANKLRALEVFTREWDEDTIAASLGWLMREMAQAIGDGWEVGIINGDNTVAHIDSDITEAPGGITAEVFINGLRQIAIDGLTAGGVTGIGDVKLTDTLVRTARSAMGTPWNVRLGSLVWIVDIQTYFQFLDLAGHQTLHDLGPQAHLLTGQVGSHDSIPIILSEFARSDLNAVGAFDGITTDQGSGILVHKDRFLIGKRPGLGVETDRWIPSDQGLIVAFDRGDFQLVEGIPATGGPVHIMADVPSI
jgi:HK97 family phage major capsid protein